MGKPHPIELRARVVAFVDEGHGHREAARHFRVSPRFVNDLIRLQRDTGSLAPRPQGNGGGHGALISVTGWIEGRIAEKGEITLDELAAELAEAHGTEGHCATVWRTLHGLGLTHKVRRIGKGPGEAFPRRTTSRRLSRRARMSPTCVVFGSPNVSHSWPTLCNGWPLLTKPRSRPTWLRPPAGRRADSALSITRRLDIGGPPLGSARSGLN